jgi:hypothetical protein
MSRWRGLLAAGAAAGLLVAIVAAAQFGSATGDATTTGTVLIASDAGSTGEQTLSATAVAATYYVDPNKGSDANDGLSVTTALRTLQKARQVVDLNNGAMSGDIVVYLRGGRHQLAAPLVFGAGDGGTNGYNVVYRAYGTTERPVVSGGIAVGGWSDSDGDGVWEAGVPAGTVSRNFIVNGVPATIARTAGAPTGVVITSTGFTTTSTQLGGLANPANIEFVWQLAWKTKIFSASSIATSGTTTTVTMKQPGWGLRDGGSDTIAGAPSWYQNAKALIDVAGEWYLDRAANKLFYKPRTGEDMARAEAILAVVDNAMVQVTGTPGAPVNNLRFEGLSFQHSTYDRPQTDQGHAGQQSNATRSTLLGSDHTAPSDAAVRTRYANNIVFENGDFRNLGASGLWFDRGTKNSAVIGSSFTNIGSNGIQVGEFLRSVTAGNNPCVIPCVDIPTADEVSAITVANNSITRIGTEARSAAQGIHAAHTKGVIITRNDLNDLGYSAIATGYRWDDVAIDSGSFQVTYNRVRNFMKSGRDGGGIYNLGNQSAGGSSVVSNNYVAGMFGNYGGLYADQGSSYVAFSNNVVENMGGRAWFHDNAGAGGAQAGLTASSNYTDTSKANLQAPFAPTGTVVYAPGSPPPAALAIKNAAGLESAYQALLSYRPAYQAEFATIGGGAALPTPSGHGYNGTGALDFNASGGYVEFAVDAGAGGSGSIAVRYMLSVTTSRTVNLTINGVTQPFTFNNTGGTSNWVVVQVPVTLNAGINTVRFTSTGQDGGALDQVQLIGFPV